ncbi:MAG: hypothetical protein AB1652_05670 [Bacillota bacterium]
MVNSKNGIPIRFPQERWFHITEEHSEMAGYYFEVLETVEDPDVIFEGKTGEFLAVKKLERSKYIVVVYKEIDENDGFIITAFLTKKIKKLERGRKVWERQK